MNLRKALRLKALYESQETAGFPEASFSIWREDQAFGGGKEYRAAILDENKKVIGHVSLRIPKELEDIEIENNAENVRLLVRGLGELTAAKLSPKSKWRIIGQFLKQLNTPGKIEENTKKYKAFNDKKRAKANASRKPGKAGSGQYTKYKDENGEIYNIHEDNDHDFRKDMRASGLSFERIG